MIRRMEPSDIHSVGGLEKKYFSVPWSEDGLLESLNLENYLFFVVEEDGEVIGYAGLSQILDEGDITNVVIDERYRGRGLGRELLENLLAAGSGQGVNAFTLEVRVSNEAAVRLYESLGFEAEGIRKGFYEKPLEDALIMWKREPEQ